jgi:hypothetical protein
MTDPRPNYPAVTPPPLTSPWTTQDPYAPYTGPAALTRSEEPYPGGPPYEPYAGGPHPDGPYEPYAGGPGHRGAPHGMPPGGRKPQAYWPLSIVGLLFSFLLGAIAIYFSVQVGRRWDRGDAGGAQRASRTARTLGILAIVVGVLGTAIILGTDR